jgi:small subunit ribosomal protein S3
MIERKFVKQNMKEYEIKEYVASSLSRVGLSDVRLQRTPLGEKIIISASRPGLVVGRAGSNITKLTRDLKEKFNLENPQIEIEEVTTIASDANIVAEMIANALERFGSQRFKGIGHKAMTDVMTAGAMGVEIIISGKIPGARATSWRFYQGYLKKCGDIALTEVRVAYRTANLKTGVVGIKVSIMPAGTVLPDKVELVQEAEPKVEELSEKDIPKSETEIIQKVEEDEEKASGKIKKTVKQDVKEESKKKEKKPAKNQSNKKPEEKGKEK